MLIPRAPATCALLTQAAVPANGKGYYCTANGIDYPSRTDPTADENIILGKSDKCRRRASRPGNFRVMLSFDYAVTANILIGLRLGYVLNTYNGQAGKTEGKAFAPFHGELRGTYVIGKDALAKAGLAPYGMIAAGIAEFDANVQVTVLEKDLPQPVNASAWNMAGPAFFSLGVGLRYAFTPRFAGMFGPRLNMAFGSNATLAVAQPGSRRSSTWF